MTRRLLPLVLLCLLPATCVADDLTPQGVADAIAKGVKWLQGQQQPDGTFKVQAAGGSNAPGGLESGYPLGTTALATLTLLKCGVAPDDPAVDKAFTWMYAQTPQRTYGVALELMAIEARFKPPAKLLEKEEEKHGYVTVVRHNFAKRARPKDKAKVQELTDWIVSTQQAGVWRYPGAASDGANEDNSNAQYALLALKSASRLGAKIPVEVFEKVADYFVAQQDPKGQEVPWFPVPAADGPIAEVPEHRPRRRHHSKAKDQDEGGTHERGAGGGSESRSMHARGWSYLPRAVTPGGAGDPGSQTNPGGGSKPGGKPRGGRVELSTGSMTASGVAALCIAKSELEKNPGSWRSRQEPVEQAIRDGCAWLALRFITTANPSSNPRLTYNWTYYYLYGCERAGVLAGTYTFGTHDWWDEGAKHLLGAQTAEGNWPDDVILSRFSTSCFALLFLKRATIPLVKLPPKRVMTGGG